MVYEKSDYLPENIVFELSEPRWRSYRGLAVDLITHHPHQSWPYRAEAPDAFALTLIQVSPIIRKEVLKLLLPKTTLQMHANSYVDHLFGIQTMPSWLRTGVTKIKFDDQLDALRLRAHGPSFPFDVLTGLKHVYITIDRRMKKIGERKKFIGLQVSFFDDAQRLARFTTLQTLVDTRAPVDRLGEFMLRKEMCRLKRELTPMREKMMEAMEAKKAGDVPFETVACVVPMQVVETYEEFRLAVDCVRMVVLGVRRGREWD